MEGWVDGWWMGEWMEMDGWMDHVDQDGGLAVKTLNLKNYPTAPTSPESQAGPWGGEGQAPRQPLSAAPSPPHLTLSAPVHVSLPCPAASRAGEIQQAGVTSAGHTAQRTGDSRQGKNVLSEPACQLGCGDKVCEEQRAEVSSLATCVLWSSDRLQDSLSLSFPSERTEGLGYAYLRPLWPCGTQPIPTGLLGSGCCGDPTLGTNLPSNPHLLFSHPPGQTSAQGCSTPPLEACLAWPFSRGWGLPRLRRVP